MFVYVSLIEETMADRDGFFPGPNHVPPTGWLKENVAGLDNSFEQRWPGRIFRIDQNPVPPVHTTPHTGTPVVFGRKQKYTSCAHGFEPGTNVFPNNRHGVSRKEPAGQSGHPNNHAQRPFENHESSADLM
jgi:hypothetical protein